MRTRNTVIVLALALALAGALPFSAAAGGSEFAYCNVPLDLPDNPGAAEMTLTQLQVVIRHGDRTPTSKLPVGTVPWECEPFAHTLRFLDVSPQAVNQQIAGPFSYPPSCAKAQLTAQGRNQHLALGAAMRKKYVGRLAFLPPTLTPSNQAQFFFRSTDYSRTHQSGQAFLVGLYPASYRIGNPTLPLRIRDVYNMRPNGAVCPRLATLGMEFQRSELFKEIMEQNLPAVRETGMKIGTWNVGTDPKTRKAQEVASFWGTISASDNLFGRVCHHQELPQGVDLEDVEAMRAAADQAFTGGAVFDRPSNEAARLQLGPFLGDLRAQIRSAAAAEPAPRMALYSAHDLTLWGLLATLSQKVDVMVPYASHMAFELWRDQQGDSWVAVEFNGDYLTVGDCPSSLCSLADFEAAIENFVPVDYPKECQEPQ